MFEDYFDTLAEFKKRKLDILTSASLDFLTFFLYGVISTLFLFKIQEHTFSAIKILQQNQAALQNSKNILLGLLGMPGFQNELNSVIFWLGLFLLCVFAFYVVLQYFSWRKIFNKKISFKRFTLRSTIYGIKLLIVIILYRVFEFVLTLNKVENKDQVIFYVLYFAIIYFAFVSYATIERGFFKSVKIVFKKKFLLASAVFALLLAILYVLSSILITINVIFGQVVNSLLILFYFTYAKLHFVKIAAKEKMSR